MAREIGYSIKINLISDNTEIFNGTFTVLQANPSDREGLITHFYNALNPSVNIFIDNGYDGADGLFDIYINQFTENGTVINSFPYFYDIYSTSAFYILYQIAVDDGINIMTENEEYINNSATARNVKFTITQISPPPITLLYSIQINLASDNTEIFNGFFSVLQTFPSDIQGRITNFYDLLNYTVDIIKENLNFVGDALFLIPEKHFSNSGTLINSFPYFTNNTYPADVFYNLYRDNGTDTVGIVTPNVEYIENINVIFTITPISRPPPKSTALLYSTKIKLAIGNTEIFNGYFTVFKEYPSDKQGIVTHFYDASNGGADIYINNNFGSEDSLYLINTNQFSYNGTNISSFPYLYDLCNNSVFYNLYQNGNRTKPDNRGRINSLDINGKVLLSIPVIFTNTLLSESPVLYFTKIRLPNNTKIFDGFFSMRQSNILDISGLVTDFYDLTDFSRGNIYTNNGGDHVYFINDDKFSSSGTNITSFPYFKNIYSNSAFYNLYNDPSGGVNVLTSNGSNLDTVAVNFTNTLISEPPPPTTLWYSIKIKLINNTEIFNGYFSVLQTNIFNNLGVVNHFYDLTNYGVDIYTNNGFASEDSTFLINSARFSSGGTNITSFPYLKLFNTNSVFYSLYRSGTDTVNLLDITGSILQSIDVIFINTQIPGPPPPPPPTTLWYSTKIYLLDNTEIFNGYFSVSQANSWDIEGVITHFYDLTNYGVDIYTHIGFDSEDSLFLINTNRFSYAGTNITSFPYFKNLYPNSDFYKLYNNGTDKVTLLTILGSVLQTVEVTFINTQISGPPPPLPPPPPPPPVLRYNLFTNNANVYYKKNSLAPCGVGSVVNSRIKSKET